MVADFDRFRSFAERYVVARAPTFGVGTERKDAWVATLDAKTIYNNIERAAAPIPTGAEGFVGQHSNGNTAVLAGPVGVTGATGPVGQTVALPPVLGPMLRKSLLSAAKAWRRR